MRLTKRQGNVLAIFRYLDTALSVETLEQRLIMQKVIYLAQRAGVDLGYRFRWYVHGPYCPLLADDYYAVASVQESPVCDEGRLDASIQMDVLDKVKAIKERRPSSEASLGQWLEATASLDYIMKVRREPDNIALGSFRREKNKLKELADYAHDAIKVLS